MPPRGLLAVVLALATLSAHPRDGSAQRRQPDTVLSLEADFIGGTVSYARARGPGRYRGVEAGLGGGFWNRMLLAGRHFAHEDGPSYETRDGFVDKELVELLHAGAFLRRVPSERVSWDVGARASVFIHFDSSDDDPGVPLFLGGYANLRVGNRWVKVGPTLLVGLFSEGSLARELGVLLVPLSGRVSFGW
ncbi:MAG: hypothetical protein AMXMBFR53_33630 [Gemmatimonadota bacterium]